MNAECIKETVAQQHVIKLLCGCICVLCGFVCLGFSTWLSLVISTIKGMYA